MYDQHKGLIEAVKDLLPAAEKTESEYIPPLPPLKRRMPCRPKTSRTRDATEKTVRHTASKIGKKVMCGKYKARGHNKKTCTSTERPANCRQENHQMWDQQKNQFTLEGSQTNWLSMVHM